MLGKEVPESQRGRHQQTWGWEADVLGYRFRRCAGKDRTGDGAEDVRNHVLRVQPAICSVQEALLFSADRVEGREGKKKKKCTRKSGGGPQKEGDPEPPSVWLYKGLGGGGGGVCPR